MSDDLVAGLDAAVQRVIDAGRLGRPVVVRWLARVGDDPGRARATLAALRAAACRWLGDDPAREHGAGHEDAGHLILSLGWPRGASAILTVAAGRDPARDAHDLVVLGSRGAVYHATGRLDGRAP